MTQAKRIIIAMLCTGLALAPIRALALETVTLQLAPGADETLAPELRRASVLVSVQAEGEASAMDVVAAARADYTRLIEALYANGYYGAVVRIRLDGREAALVDPFAIPDRFTTALITVDPGRPFRFGRAEIGPLAAGAAPPEAFRSGAPALATTVRDAARDAVAGWRAASHAKAQVSGQTVLARHDSAQLDVAVEIAPGRAARFGQVSVSGETDVRAPRVRQIAGVPQGAPFDPETVDKAAERLRKTGTFQSVTVEEAAEIAPDGTLDLQISVVDREPRRIGAGIGVSSLDGLTLSGFWLHRNILGGAERLRIEGRAAQLGGGLGADYSLSARFERPAVYGPDTLFYSELSVAHSDEEDFLEDEVRLTFGASREFSDTLTGDMGVGLTYTRVTDRFDAVAPEERELLLYSVPAALTWDTRGDTLDPRDGVYVRAELEPFYETRESQSGARLSFDARGYRAVGGEAAPVVLAGRLQLGSLVGPDAVNAPPGFLFYSGGGGTVRGQPYQSLDADYDNGAVLGGLSFAALSGEIRYDFTDRFGLVAFADAGFVGNESGGGDGDWHAGAGLGLRYATPVGPIRFDVAGPVAGDTGDGVHLYIGIGQAF